MWLGAAAIALMFPPMARVRVARELARKSKGLSRMLPNEDRVAAVRNQRLRSNRSSHFAFNLEIMRMCEAVSAILVVFHSPSLASQLDRILRGVD